MGLFSWLFGSSEPQAFVVNERGQQVGVVVDGRRGDKWVTWEMPNGSRRSVKASSLRIEWNDRTNKGKPDFDATRTNPEYDAMNRPRGVSVRTWNAVIEREIDRSMNREYAKHEALALEAQWEIALHLVDHPGEIKHRDSREMPPEELMQAAREHRGLPAESSNHDYVGGDGESHRNINGQHVSYRGGRPQIVNGKMVK